MVHVFNTSWAELEHELRSSEKPSMKHKQISHPQLSHYTELPNTPHIRDRGHQKRSKVSHSEEGQARYVTLPPLRCLLRPSQVLRRLEVIEVHRRRSQSQPAKHDNKFGSMVVIANRRHVGCTHERTGAERTMVPPDIESDSKVSASRFSDIMQRYFAIARGANSSGLC